MLEWPNVDEKTGVKAPRLSSTRAASTSVPSRTMARSGLFSTARRTASSSVSRSVGHRSTESVARPEPAPWPPATRSESVQGSALT